MRGFIAGLLILIGAALTIPASIAMWEQRVIADQAAFVEVGREVLEKPAVQDQLTLQITDEVTRVVRANNIDLSDRPVLGAIAGNGVEPITRTIVAGLPDSVIGTAVLIAAHEAVMRVIDEDRGRLESSDDEIRINVRPAIESVLEGVPGLSSRIELPEDTGQVVIVQEEDAALAFQALRWFHGAAWYIAAVPVVCYVLALAIATNRSRTLILIGLSLIVAAALRIFFYKEPLRSMVTNGVTEDRPDLADAATGIYDAVIASLVTQDLLLIGAGVICVVTGIVLTVLRPSNR